jgi:hypothetical protein
VIFSNTKCSKVESGVVVTSGTFASLISPASPFKEGFPEARAKTEFGVYKIQPIPSVNAGQTREVVDPYYSADDDAVYNEIVRDRTPSEIEKRNLSLTNVRKSEASTEFGSRVAAGFVVAGIRFGMNATAFETLTQAKALLTETPGTPIKAVTSFGSRVDVTSAAQADAVIAALRVEYNRLVGKEAALYDAIDTYDFSQLQALDVTSDSHWS